MQNEEKYRWLFGLRRSGQVNMFTAGPLLAQRFHLTAKEAKDILIHWMEHFDSISEQLGEK